MARDPASNQLVNYKNNLKDEGDTIRTSFGAPVDNRAATLTAGPKGPIVLQDYVFLDELQHFDRERIPERRVHAKGAGAFGYFEVTHDITKYCKAKLFSEIGKRTPVAIRFSTTGGEVGSADTVRDPRGFAVKYYTEDGIWDHVGINSPVFFISDPILFPSLIHSVKRNPATHLKDPDMFWDFVSLRPETSRQIMFVFSDRGIPESYRYINGYPVHTFKLVNEKNQPVYCKFHYVTDQGIKNMPVERANKLAASDPDHSTRDLYNAIAEGNFPSWTLFVQVMTFEQAEKHRWNPFDVTKEWLVEDFPLIPVGKVVLNRNPSNYFAEVEQLALSPAHLIPGVEPSPDKILQGRMFAYIDSQLHRLGANYRQIPVNCPYRTRITNYQRDGPMNVTNNQEGAPNYYPNSFGGPKDDPSAALTKFPVTGDVMRYNTGEDYFSQATLFWKAMTDGERDRLISNIVGSLKDAVDVIQERTVNMFSQVDINFGARLMESLRQQAKARL